jgi:hypothetical protein
MKRDKRYIDQVLENLYLVKYSRPDIANALRELAKFMGKATPAAYKDLKRVIKFVMDKRNLANM